MNKYSWASLHANSDFIQISTQSGNGITLLDPNGIISYHDPNADNSSLGKAVIDSLNASRIVDPTKEPDFFDYRGKAARDHQKWMDDIMTKYAYKTKNRLFRKMIHCSIEESDGVITIAPTRHVKLEAWEGDKEEMPLEITSKYNSPEEIGAAVRRAMEKCIP